MLHGDRELGVLGLWLREETLCRAGHMLGFWGVTKPFGSHEPSQMFMSFLKLRVHLILDSRRSSFKGFYEKGGPSFVSCKFSCIFSFDEVSSVYLCQLEALILVWPWSMHWGYIYLWCKVILSLLEWFLTKRCTFLICGSQPQRKYMIVCQS